MNPEEETEILAELTFPVEDPEVVIKALEAVYRQGYQEGLERGRREASEGGEN